MKKPRAIDDIIDDYQRRLAAMPTWTKEKRELVQELRSELASAGFHEFTAHRARCFHLTGLGNDTVRSIPENRRGALSHWRGKTVRIICIEPGRYERGYAAGPTTKPPQPYEAYA
jgi:hypothetical protein